MNLRRLILRDLGVSMAVIMLGLFLASCRSSESASTPPLSPTSPPPQRVISAPGFELTNQFGQMTSLSQLRGKVVILTFLYTNCPDTCPLYISNIQLAMTELGSSADEVALMAITVDPERDSVETLREYTSSLPFSWLYLTGEPEQLKAVWSEYGIYVEKLEEETTAGHSHAGHEGYEVIHTTIVKLIDRDGDIGADLIGWNWQAGELIEKLRPLLTEK